MDRHELDTILFVALRIARESWGPNTARPPLESSLTARLVANFRTVVGIDEGADFSAVELACMRLLAHPRFDSVSIACDPMQRLTDTGIHHLDELGLLLPAPETHALNISYRQTPRLLKMASDLYRTAMGHEAVFKSAYGDSANDPAPLLANTTDQDTLVQWLAQRILEIYRACGNRLPSIAVLVPSDNDIGGVERRLRPLLEEHSIDITACFRGEALGTDARVRIFDIRYIKGLEFEAVFYLDLDVLAEQEPNLIDKYLYVGLTRARSFLGITVRKEFPSQLACVRAQFDTGDWRSLASPVTI